MPSAFSVLILTSGRDAHLLNTLAGVARMKQQPAEVVVVFMNQLEHPELPASLNVRAIDITNSHRLPLAQARNRLAREARTDRLVFLDVDCVPSTQFAGDILLDLKRWGGLVMGSPHYLEQGASTDSDETMGANAREHPVRKSLGLGPTDRHQMFWSLCFAMNKNDFVRAGGFDETFVGYGGEDTDFSLRCRETGIEFAISEAVAFHQDHPSYNPPLNHFEDVVANAQAFYYKWNVWPMKKWLQSFSDLQLIAWDPEGDKLQITELPTRFQLEAALLPSAVS